MSKPPTTRPHINGLIHFVSPIMSNVMGSAVEAKIEGTSINSQEAVPIGNLLLELGHPQPDTPIKVDNSTTDGFANTHVLSCDRSSSLISGSVLEKFATLIR